MLLDTKVDISPPCRGEYLSANSYLLISAYHLQDTYVLSKKELQNKERNAKVIKQKADIKEDI